MTELETDKGRPLTEEEVAEVRSLLEKDKRVTWFWTTARVWAGWLTAVGAAYLATKSFLAELITGLNK
jgi:hypothetical protein